MKTRSKILVALIIVFGFIFLLPHGRYRHQLEAYKKELLARGEKLTIAELAPPRNTNAANGAKAFLQLMSDYIASVNDSPRPPMMKMVAPGLAAIGCVDNNPALTTNYAEHLGQMAKLRNILTATALDFDLDYSNEAKIQIREIEAKSDNLKEARSLASISAMQALHARNYSEARADLLTAVDLVRLCNNNPLLTIIGVDRTQSQLAAKITWEGLQSGEWTDPQLAELQAKWQNLDLSGKMETFIPFTRAYAITMMTEARVTNSGLAIEQMSSHALGTPGGGERMAALLDKVNELYNRYPRYWTWKSSWSYDEELYFLKEMDVALSASRIAVTTGAFVPAFDKFKQEEAGMVQLHPEATNHFLFSSPNDSWLESVQLGYADTETARRLTVTAFALKRHHLQHGAYPATLNDLVPAFLAAVPADFMDGKPLRYKLRPDKDFLLYSVGEDGIDDGGDPSPVPPSTSFYNWLTGRDIVWPRVATPATLEEYNRLSQSVTNAPTK